MLSLANVKAIIGAVTYKPTGMFTAANRGTPEDPTFLIQYQEERACTSTGKLEMQKGRKWFISRHSTEDEIVQTCLLALKTFEEHELRERFKYKGHRVFGPHLRISKLSEISHDTVKRDQVTAPPGNRARKVYGIAK